MYEIATSKRKSGVVKKPSHTARERERSARARINKALAGTEFIGRNDVLATAFHEAAHCVFSEAFGITVQDATCLPCIDSKGARCLGLVKTNSDKILLPGVLHIVHALVGDIAEHRLLCGTPYKMKWISSTDAEDILNCIEQMKCDDPTNAREEVFRLAEQARDLVEKSFHWIHAVGIEMYAKETLQGDEVRTILNAHGFYNDNNPLVEFAEESNAFMEYIEARKQFEQSGVPEVQIKDMEQQVERFINSFDDAKREEFKQWCQKHVQQRRNHVPVTEPVLV